MKGAVLEQEQIKLYADLDILAFPRKRKWQFAELLVLRADEAPFVHAAICANGDGSASPGSNSIDLKLIHVEKGYDFRQ